jgi:hypothetical protein
MTEKGKERKQRIIEKLYFQPKKTDLHLDLYVTVLQVLKEYVMVFQATDVRIHKLHDEQLSIFLKFLSFYIKPESIGKKCASSLKSLNLDDKSKVLQKRSIFVGAMNRNTIKSGLSKSDPIIVDFMKRVEEAYFETGKYLQSKLPLDSAILQGLSAIDPMARGHSVTTSHLYNLCDSLSHILPAEHRVFGEVYQYISDPELDKIDDCDIVKFWNGPIIKERYQCLHIIVSACLSIFHGPSVESSFSVMNNIVDSNCSRTSVETFNAYQTVKYSLRSKKINSVERFRRNHTRCPIDRPLALSVQRAWSEEKKLQRLRQKKRLQRLLGCKRATSATFASKARQVFVNTAIQKYIKKTRSRSSRRGTLSE